MSRQWHIGCSGFHYREWKGEFYPQGLPQKNWFDYYTQHFNTLELNVTFYRFPTPAGLKGWYDKAPEGFTFSAKMPRLITHYKRFVDTASMVGDFYGLLAEGLKEKLACVLTQLPPQFSYSEEGLFSILEQLDNRFMNVIEFRHASWWREDVELQLAAHGVSFAGVSFPAIAEDEAIVNNGIAYYRFHGVPRLFYSEYDRSFVETVFRQLNSSDAEKVFVYFNNTASLAALHNASQMKEMLRNMTL